jgi:polysaccharide biosynthesis protein PelA
MLVTMLRISVGLLLWLSLCSFAASPNVAFFYGSNPPWDELKAFDVVVVEPEHNIDPKLHSSPRTEVFAYVSMGEVHRERPYARDLPAAWLPGANDPWNSVVIDQTQPQWPRFLIDRIIAPLWKAGYRGFFLDTLDSFHIIAKTDDERARQAQALANTVRLIRTEYPEAKLIFNRGFEILPQLSRDVYAVAVESIYRGWNAKEGQYVEVSEQDRTWILDQMRRVREEYKLPVIAIDYVPPGSRELARDTARKISALGFTPWVANSELHQLGVGAIEVMPRKILMLYEGNGNEFSLYEDRIHSFATMPLNYLGYAVEYADINQPLPAGTLVGRYAGIVTWFASEQAGRKPGFLEWLSRQRSEGMRIAMFGSFPFPLSANLAKDFGLVVSNAKQLAKTLSVDFADPLIGFEAQPLPERRFFLPLAAPGGKPLLRWRSDAGDTMVAASMMPWGGYVLSPYEILSLPNDAGNRWIVQPFEFLRQALALPAMPVPDATTENGRRLMLVHIDGDGFVNLSERPGTPFAGEVLLTEVLQKYRIPHTVSVIQGEIAPNGLYPKLSPRLEPIARRIFALPHVEIASHTFSHPFRWSTAAATADQGAYHLNIPGYGELDLDLEIRGSIDYINSRLAPPNKRARMVFWTGDTNPGSEAVAKAYEAGVLNMNGGGALTTRRNRSFSSVWPLGMQKGSYFQIHAPNHNENVYTNNWTGPFYGFERVIETFELTETPMRLKPIDIYYHAYSASKRASLTALDRVYQWALKQPVMNVYASEYAQKVLDFNRMVVARGPDGWIVRGGESLRELRVPSSMGVPDLSASRAIAGYQTRGTDTYVHTADSEAVLRLAPQVPAQPYLADANGRLSAWRRDGSTMQFSLQAHVPLRFSLANVAGCRVEGDGRPLTGVAQGGITRYELKQNGIERISVSCAS